MKKLQLILMALLVSAMSWGAVTKTTFTYEDFSGKGTSGSGSSASVTKDGVTVGSDKLYGSTEEVRIYSGTITITAGNNISKIEITSTAYQTSSYGPAKLSYTGSDGTYTTASGSKVGTWTAGDFAETKSVALKASAQFRFTQVDVYTGSEDVTVNSLTLNKKTTTIVEGKKDTLVATVDPADTKIKWESTAPLIAEVSTAGVVRGLTPGNALIIASAGEKADTCSVTVTGDGEYIWFNQVTTANLSDLKNGDKVMIGTSSVLMGAWTTGNNIAPITTGLKYSDDGTKCRETEDAIYTLIKDGENWNLQDKNGNYLQITGAKAISAGETVNANAKLGIAISSGDLKITNSSNGGYGWIQYNSSAGFFTTYTSYQSMTKMFYRHNDEASSLSWTPDEVVFDTKRLTAGNAKDTAELTLNFANMDADGVLFEVKDASSTDISFGIVGDLINLEDSGTIRICYSTSVAGTYTANLHLLATAKDGQEWDRNVPISVTVLEQAAPLSSMTVSALMTAAANPANGIGNWGYSTVAETNCEFLLGNVTVVAHHGAWLFVQDATGTMCIYDNLNRTHAEGVYYAKGDVLSGIRGKVKVSKNAVMLLPGEAYTITKKSSGASVAPQLIRKTQTITAGGAINTFVRIEKATFAAGDMETAKLKLDGSTISLNNLLGLNQTVDSVAKHYDVEGFVWANGSAMQLVPMTITERDPNAPGTGVLELSVVGIIYNHVKLENDAASQEATLTVTGLELKDSIKVSLKKGEHMFVLPNKLDSTGGIVSIYFSATEVGTYKDTVVVTGTDHFGGKLTASCYVSMTVETLGDSVTYKLLQVADSLKEGDKVFIGTAANDVVVGLYDSGSNIKGVAATYSADRHQVTASDAYAYTVQKDGDKFIFVDSYGRYLYMYNTNKNLSSSTTLDNKAKWTVAIADDVATIKSVYSSSFAILFNKTAAVPMFCTYSNKDANFADVVLYSNNAPDYVEKVLHPSFDVMLAGEAVGDTLDWGEVVYDDSWGTEAAPYSALKSLTIQTTDLESAIDVAVSGNAFSCLTSSVPAKGGQMSVNFETTQAGTYNGTLTLTCDTIVRTIVLQAKAVREPSIDPTVDPTVSVTTKRVYLNPNYTDGYGEDMAVFYFSAANMKKNLYCKWTGASNKAIPNGEMTVEIDGFSGDLAYGSAANLGTASWDSAEVTVYVKLFTPGMYTSQLHFYTYGDDKNTIVAEAKVDLVVNMTENPTPDPGPDPVLTVSKTSVALNMNDTTETGEAVATFNLTATDLKNALFCEWNCAAGDSVPTAAGDQMSISIANFGALTFGQVTNMDTLDREKAEVTLTVKAVTLGTYRSQLHFYCYADSSTTIALEKTVAIEVVVPEKPNPGDGLEAVQGSTQYGRKELRRGIIVIIREETTYDLQGRAIDD